MHEKFLAEASKKTKETIPPIKGEGGVQTRQLKEAGVSTTVGKSLLRGEKNDTLKDSTVDQ